jgi:hypothetical protein
VKYKEGDRVRVKSLEELSKIGIHDLDGDIRHRDGDLLFVNSMKFLCGNEYIIKSKIIFNSYFLEGVNFAVEDWMLEGIVKTVNPKSTPRNKYDREILPNTYVDVYDVLRAFEVTDQALGHLIKKALAVGKRGHKTAEQDYKDILDSAQRAYEQYKQWNEVDNG